MTRLTDAVVAAAPEIAAPAAACHHALNELTEEKGLKRQADTTGSISLCCFPQSAAAHELRAASSGQSTSVSDLWTHLTMSALA